MTTVSTTLPQKNGSSVFTDIFSWAEPISHVRPSGDVALVVDTALPYRAFLRRWHQKGGRESRPARVSSCRQQERGREHRFVEAAAHRWRCGGEHRPDAAVRE